MSETIECTKTDEMIKIITSYFQDPRNNMALFINGPWGSGKSYFVFNKLIESLKKIKIKNLDNTKKYKTNEIVFNNGKDTQQSMILYHRSELTKKHKCKHKYKVFGISLNGIDNCEELNKHLVNAALLSKRKNFFKKKDDRVFNISSKITSGILNYAGVTSKNLLTINDFYNVNNCVIIFDDFERCLIDTKTLLGYISNFSEYDNVKVLVIGNEEEIVANNEESPISDYEKLKEKVFFRFINFLVDPKDIFMDIINEYYSYNETYQAYADFLKRNATNIINYLNNLKCKNFRTIVFALQSFELTFLNIIDKKVIDLEKISEEIERDKVLFKILRCYIKEAYLFKEPKATEAKNGDETVGIRTVLNHYLDSDTAHYLHLMYIENQLQKGAFDTNVHKRELEAFFKYEFSSYKERKKHENDPLYKIDDIEKILLLDYTTYLTLTEKIYENLNNTKKNNYHYGYDEMRNVILYLSNAEANGIPPYKSIDKYVEIIKAIFIENSEFLLSSRMHLLDEMICPDSMHPKKYKEYVKDIASSVGHKDFLPEYFKDMNEIIKNKIAGNWGIAFFEYCEKNRRLLETKASLLMGIDLKILIEKIQHRNNKDLRYFYRTLFSFYGTDAIRITFYRKDFSSLVALKNFIDTYSKQQFSDQITKLHISWISEYINLCVTILSKELNNDKQNS